ncbi:MAG: energy-coupling factor transporter transmembrane protein EcfT [Nitrospirota bacterium]|nr:energy-coupling factor transporter transmembrane protein EcfT [Nitrospirota bacterium]
MIDVARIDQWASDGDSPLHRASVAAKLLFVGLVVCGAVIARDPVPLALGFGLLLAVAMTIGLPWRAIGFLSLYAALFALLYAVSLRRGAWVYALVLLKSVTPAFAVGMLIVTTPYPRIFSVLSGFLPEIVASGLFMTYRSFFILLDMMDSFGTSIRLRGGFSPGNIIRNGTNIAKGIGALLVRAVDRSSRLYAVMSVRGYNGSMAEHGAGAFTAQDWLPLGAGAAVLAVVLAW